MRMKKPKRKPIFMIITFSLIGAIVTYFAFFRHSLFWLIPFYVMLLFGMTVLSGHASEKMMGLVREKYVFVERQEAYCAPIRNMYLYIFLIALPFYLIWFLVSFIAALNTYAFIILYLPILTISFLTFGFPFFAWNTLGGRGWCFWCFHIAFYFVTQFLGWIVRSTFLQELYF